MNTSFSPLKNAFSVAVLRLKVWFDPAQEGNPYESSPLFKKETQYSVVKRYGYLHRVLAE